MRPLSISITTENLALPANAASHTVELGSGLAVTVTSPCIGQARNLAADFSLALEYGAAPAVQALMIEQVRAAEERGIPLSCMLSFGV